MSDWFYRISRALLEQTIRLYYRRIETLGLENLPAAGPAILVANHPNSVPDAYLLASQLTRRRINFIATDVITRMPVIGWLAGRFGVVGVARAMDYAGRRTLARQRNQSAVELCVPRLLRGELLAIFGEGISDDARRLHIIRKGAMRFGYAAEAGADFQLGLVWIPVGINYSAKQRFRSDVLIHVGKPFGLADLSRDPAEDPRTHEAVLLQRGTERLQHDVEALVVNIEKEELAELMYRLSGLLENPVESLSQRVERSQRFARVLEYFNVAEPQRVVQIQGALRRYQEQLADAGLSDEVVSQRHPAAALWIHLRGVLKSGALMVLNLYGWANSFVPRWSAALAGPLGRERAAAEDTPGEEPRVVVAREALWATYGGWLGGAVAFPAQTYLVYRWALRGWGLSIAIVVAVLYAASLVPSWRLFVHRRDVLRQHWTRARDAWRFLTHSAQATRLRGERQRLVSQVRAVLAAYDAAAPRPA